jgi:PIN domain nuclease of toxin-antitoxin system
LNFVTDTHPLVWYLADETKRLGRRALRAFSDADVGRSTVHVPAVVLMEIALLEQKGVLAFSYRDLRDQLAARPGLPIEALTASDVDEARALVGLKDPFDRMIAGSSIRLGLPLLSRDTAFRDAARIRTFW